MRQVPGRIYHDRLSVTTPLQEVSGMNPLDDVTAFAAQLEPVDRIMLVGHLPFMERLAAFLLTGKPDKQMIKFQNGGIVCLEKEAGTGGWFVKWILPPNLT